ncbi:MAG: DUF502 domain-containing protein [Myxococcota bacterium]
MNRIVKSFGQGLLILAPIAITAYVVWWLVTSVDGWLDLGVPGLGLLIVLAGITLIGFLATNVMGRRVLDVVEQAMSRVPVVKLLYTSLKDLLDAFVGDKRRFERPVMVELGPDRSVKVLGFMTCDRFEDPQLAEHVGVYCPQSYNFAGNLLVVPRERVKPIDADGAQFMAFVMSGGVAEMGAARTVYDDGQALPLSRKR